MPIEAKRKTCFEKVTIYYIYTSFQTCSNGSVSIGENRELFKTDGDINCILSFWSSITEANPLPSPAAFHDFELYFT